MKEAGHDRLLKQIKQEQHHTKELAASLERERDTLEVIMENTNAHLAYLDPEFNFILVNSTYVKGSGHTKEELIGRNHFELFPNPENETIFKKVRDTGEPIEFKAKPFEFVDQPWRGVTYWDWTLTPVKDSSGHVVGLVLSLVDVTESILSKQLSDVLNSISAAISSTLSFDEIMQRIVVEATKAVSAESAIISLHEDGFWSIRYIYSLPEELLSLKFYDDQAKSLMMVAKAKKIFITNDAFNDERVDRGFARAYNIRSFMVIPLIVRGEVIGTLNFNYHTRPVFFTEVQVDFASKLASSISLSLENAQLYSSIQEELSRTKLLQDVAVAATTEPDLHVAAGGILKALSRHLKLKTGVIQLLDEEKRVLTALASFGYPEEMLNTIQEIPVDKSDTLAARAVRERKMLTHKDKALAPERKRIAKEVVVENGRYMATPIDYRDKLVGILLLSFGERRDFAKAELDLFSSIASIAGQAIENVRLYEVERRIADTLQESLLTVPERIEGITYGYLYRSATEAAKVGGDFYDIFELEHDRVGIVVGDVSGKGIDAASLTTVVKSTIKAHAYEDGTPALVLAKTNDLMFRVSPPGSFVTVFFGVLDTATGKITYCSAGHPPALIKRETGIIKQLTRHSPLIGVFSDLHYRSGKETVRRGDTLVLYTDGIIEARCDAGFFGEERLVDFVQNLEPIPANKMPQAIFNEVMSCSGGRLSDDVALLCISLGGG